MENNSDFEIELTLDSGLIVDFVPDFRVQKNTADHSSVSWGLPSRATPLNVGILCDEFQAESTIYSPVLSRSDV